MSYVDFNGITMSVGRASYGGDSSDVSDNLTEDVVNIYSTVGAFAALKSDGSVVTWGGIEGVVSYNHWLTDGSFNLYYIREGENGTGESRVGINRNYPQRSVDMSGTIRMGDQGTTDSIFLDFSGSDAFGRYTEISGNARDNIRKIVTSQYFTLILYQSGVVYLYTNRDRTNLGQIAGIHGTTGVLDIATQEYDLDIDDQLVVAIMTDGTARAWTFAGPSVDTIIDELEDAPYKFRSIAVGTVHTSYGSTTKTCVAITYDDTYQSYGRIFPSGLYTSSIGTDVQQVGTGENIVVYLRRDGRVVMNLVHSGLGMFDPDDIGYNSLQNIVQISVGKSHIVALDTNGIAYGWQGSSIPSTDTRVKGIGPLSVYPNIYSRDGVWNVTAGGAHTVLLLRDNNTIVACGKTHSPTINGTIPADVYSGVIRVFAGSHTTFVQDFEPNNRIDGATQFRDRIIVGDSSGALSHGAGHTMALYDTRSAGSAGSLYIGGLGDNTAYSRMTLGDDISYNAPYASKWSFEHGRGGPIDENHMRISYTSGNRRVQPVTMDTSGNVRIGYEQDTRVYTHRLDVCGNVNMTGALTTGHTATIGNNFFVRNNALCVVGNQVGIGTTNPTPGTLLDVDGNARVDGNMTITGTTSLDTITLQNGYSIGSYFTVSTSGVGIGTTTLVETLTVSGNASISNTIYGRRAIVGKTPTDPINANAQLDVSGHTVLSGKIGIGIGNTVPASVAMDVSGAVDLNGTTRIFGSTNIIRNQVTDTALDVSGMTIFRGGNVGIGKTNPTARLDVIGTASVVGNASVMGNLGIGKTNPSAALDVVGTSNLAGQTVIYGNVGIGKNPLASLDVVGSILVSENIGIGKTNPSVALDIIGSSAVSGTSNLVGNVAIGKTTPASVALDVSGQSYVSAKSSFGSIVSISGETFMTSNVGIGKTTTTTHLDVSGNAIISNRMSVGKTTLPVLTTTSLDVSGNTQVVGNVTISGDTIITSKMNVGKSTAPNGSYTVDVSGSVRSSALVNADTLDISGNSIFRSRVGIGLTVPTSALDVSGNAVIRNKISIGKTDISANLDVSGTLSLGNYRIVSYPVEDSAKWITHTLNNDISNSWLDITWAQEASGNTGLFVAVGLNSIINQIIVSADGLTWTSYPTPNNVAILSICWSPQLGLFVGVGQSAIVTSSNGHTWNSYSHPNILYKVIWSSSKNMFIATGVGYGNSYNGPYAIYYSTDGTIWNYSIVVSDMPNSNITYVIQSLCEITSGPDTGSFVAVVYSTSNTNIWGFPENTAPSPIILISTNGTTWTGSMMIQSLMNITGFACTWSKKRNELIVIADKIYIIKSLSNIDTETFTYIPGLSNPSSLKWIELDAITMDGYYFMGGYYDSLDPTNTHVYISTDTITWSSPYVNYPYNLRSFAFSPKLERIIGIGDYQTSFVNKLLYLDKSVIVKPQLTITNNGIAVGKSPSVNLGNTLDIDGTLKISASPDIDIVDDASYFWNQTSVGPTIGGNNFQIRTGSANLPRFHITSGGNVGIGTVTPSTAFEVSGNMNVVGNLSIQGSFTLPALSIPGSSSLIGNVGIGKNATSNTLDVNGNGVFSSSMTIGSNLTVDTDTLVVDANNNRIGICMSNPTKTLEVAGSSRISSTLDVSGETNITGNLGVKTNVFVVDTAFNRVGIGLSTPSAVLEVSGNVIVDRDVFVVDTAFNRVGIGLSTPSAVLDVSGSAKISGDITTPVLIGQVSYFASTTAPTGWLKCNGSLLARTTYPALFNFLVPKSSTVTFDITLDTVTWNNHGLTTNDIVYFTTSGTLPTGLTAITTPYYVNTVTTNTFKVASTSGGSAINITGTPTGTHTAWNAPFGIGNGSTTFAIPDLRGLFIRGFRDGSSTYETDSNRAFGSYQADEIISHRHRVEYYNNIGSGPGSVFYAEDGTGWTGLNTTYTGGAETRPKNIALLACIKY